MSLLAYLHPSHCRHIPTHTLAKDVFKIYYESHMLRKKEREREASVIFFFFPLSLSPPLTASHRHPQTYHFLRSTRVVLLNFKEPPTPDTTTASIITNDSKPHPFALCAWCALPLALAHIHIIIIPMTVVLSVQAPDIPRKLGECVLQ